MRISKKIYTTLIIAILTLSTIATVIPIALAINVPVLTPNTGPVDTEVEVAVTGSTAFGLVEVYWKTLATKIGEGYADGTGAIDIDVDVPNAILGTHDIIVQDVLGSAIQSAVFTVTEEVEISTESGLPGDSVTVTGTGFGDELPVGIYLGTITSVAAEVLTLSAAPVTGTLAEMPIVIGTVVLTVDVTVDGTTTGAATGTGVVTVTDDGEGNLAGSTADIAVTDGVDPGEVDVTITGTINYATGVITLAATGVDSAGANTVTAITVTIDTPAAAAYDYAQYEVTPALGLTSSDVGFFEAVTTIPTIAVIDYGAYAVTAIDSAGNQAAAANPLTVDYYVIVNPTSGPAGITITISGRIPASTAYELRLGTTTIATGTSGADTTFSNTHVVSSFLALGGHTITVVWGVTNTRTTTFTVTNPPQVLVSPTAGVAGATITISSVPGFPFSAGANITLYINAAMVNGTSMDDRFGPTVAFGPAAGSFTDLEFAVPAIAPGVYVLTVTDEFGATTGNTYSFTVLPTPVTAASLNGATYYLGETLSFSFLSSDTITVNPTVTIRDPSGTTWWTATWTPTAVGTSWTVVFQAQVANGNPITLPADAPTGTWNWTVTYTATAAGAVTATGLFTVLPVPTMQTVLDRLDVMETSIESVITTSEGKIIAVVNTKTGQIMTEIAALDPQLQAITDTAVIIATMLGEVQVDIAALDLGALDALGVQITAIKGDVATIKTNIGTVNTAVGTLDAVLGAVAGQLVEVQTSLGTLEGKITAIEGNTATIETSVGTLQADVTDVKAEVGVDMTPVWIAVVLSLVAAIAAIFAVITIRQKIAG